ncbi:probable serine/threonine-protein kinase DDB_G0280111 [Selaginella moellendorffii]|uniref:probable serine/threonine-protein kinase DDB_G0280111 n=1 Tax=Selaginella moellendorffii TaxID=88036 RepID=UPI000D1C9F0F|nr:probable serine/threonine-protein kinase DDB_G0280111 [Selaginella moellendorffii]|eukprot:XP_024533487.1 probable serine/threonine-protein kinase DDB_G0280111 [Selaginella moellendorffii]
MWRLKQLMPKDQAGLEGKSVEVGTLKLQVRSVVAEGGFSSVYLARDAQSGKNYALKHLICNDDESLHLVRKEVAVMKALRGHPNIVTLHAHAVLANGRTKECFLVMDYCEKTLVAVLDARGAGFFEERQLLSIFRDICNAVYAMHCQSPPIAHRDLKAENILLGANGLWKLCDFGSISTNHRRFERAEEMGVEEDVIRKHTTPAYRAPEMWDLYQRELISEKVDIWALGCLLYRLCFFKSAFDGESKLQILNGNYRIPEAPRYSENVTQLIKDMLMPSPGSRPDILQVWNRVNEALPIESRKTFPDKASSTVNSSIIQDSLETKPPVKTPSPPPAAKTAGSFWSSQLAADAKHDSDSVSSNNLENSVTPPVTSGGPPPGWSAGFNGSNSTQKNSVNSVQTENANVETRPGNLFKKGGVAHFVKKVGSWNKDDGDGDGYAMMSEVDMEQQLSAPSTKVSEVSNDGAFNAFVAEFDSAASAKNVETEKLKLQLKQALAEKTEFAGKYEKLTAICRSQRQEIHELKSALAAATVSKEPMPKPPLQSASAQSRRTSRPVNWNSSTEQDTEKDKDKQNGSIWDLQSGLTAQAPSKGLSQQAPLVDSSPWSAFGDAFKGSSTKSSSPTPPSSDPPLNTGSGPPRRQHARAASLSGGDTWGFNSSGSSSMSLNQQQQQQQQDSKGGFRSSTIDSSQSSRSQAPAGWAGF